MTYQQLKNSPIDLKKITENCRFFLVRRKVETLTQEYKQEDFEQLRLVKIQYFAELEKDQSDFMGRNSLELEYSQIGFDGVSSQQEYLRASTFLVFTFMSDRLFSLKDIPSSLKQDYMKPFDIYPSQKIINISSPFGLNAKELFLNVRYKGIVTNEISQYMYLTDLDGHLVNVEGSPVFDKKTSRIIGIRLPNTHTFNLYMSCSSFAPIHIIFQNIFQGNSKLPTSPSQRTKSFRDIVVKVKDANLNSSGVLINNQLGLVLTNSHCIESVQSSPRVRIDGVWYRSKVIAKSVDQETLDVCLLQILDEDQGTLSEKLNQKIRIWTPSEDRLSQIKEGDQVFAVGYGYYQELAQASIYSGYITRLVYHKDKQYFVQHTAKTYAGQSGGALFDKYGNFVGLLFKNSILNVNEEKSIKLQLDQMCTAVSVIQLLPLLKMITTKYAPEFKAEQIHDIDQSHFL